MSDIVKETAANNKKRNKRLLIRLKNKPDKWLDLAFQESHEHAFNQIDCLHCANCCKTTGPLFTKSDIQRISKHFSLKTSEFISKYLQLDEDEDYVLQKVPCPFLGENNFCNIYEERPKACREYPHTDMHKQKKLLPLHLKNASICPAIDLIFRKIEESLP
jgi:Fe-S-cluster containining protein